MNTNRKAAITAGILIILGTIAGFVGTTLTMLASLFLLFRFIDVVTPIYMVLNLPMALQEIVLAIWLIAKGFNPTAIASVPVKQI